MSKGIKAGVLVAALGYFVDVYDLILFTVVRVASLKDLGFVGDELTNNGIFLLNVQMAGMLLGGILWGVLGDVKGRLSVLFGSIGLYSIANIANGYVHTVEAYALCRFIAGIGLAGELGAGVTLVSEIMDKERRGIGTTIIATVGVTGAVVAGLVGDSFYWRTSYIVGGLMGLVLLVMRVAVYESGMFEKIKNENVSRGNFLMLFKTRERFFRYLACVFVGLPIWYAVGILITFSPEIASALAIVGEVSAGKMVLFCYIGFTLGDLASGLLSQYLKSRKKAIVIFLLAFTVSIALYLSANEWSAQALYYLGILLGFCGGYWAVFITNAAEHFGTNLRATVATTAPNFVRGATVLTASAFHMLSPSLGVISSAAVVGGLTLVIAVLAIFSLEESFGRDLNFIEE